MPVLTIEDLSQLLGAIAFSHQQTCSDDCSCDALARKIVAIEPELTEDVKCRFDLSSADTQVSDGCCVGSDSWSDEDWLAHGNGHHLVMHPLHISEGPCSCPMCQPCVCPNCRM